MDSEGKYWLGFWTVAFTMLTIILVSIIVASTHNTGQKRKYLEAYKGNPLDAMCAWDGIYSNNGGQSAICTQRATLK